MILGLTDIRRFLVISYIKVLHNIFCIAGWGGEGDTGHDNIFAQRVRPDKNCSIDNIAMVHYEINEY